MEREREIFNLSNINPNGTRGHEKRPNPKLELNGRRRRKRDEGAGWGQEVQQLSANEIMGGWGRWRRWGWGVVVGGGGGGGPVALSVGARPTSVGLSCHISVFPF